MGACRLLHTNYITLERTIIPGSDSWAHLPLSEGIHTHRDVAHHYLPIPGYVMLTDSTGRTPVLHIESMLDPKDGTYSIRSSTRRGPSTLLVEPTLL
jgi:hypothetical protein